MATFAEMVPAVQQNLPACPQPVVESYLLRAVAEMCRESFAWIETLAAVDVLPAAFPYAVVPGTGKKVVKVFRVEIDGQQPPLEKVTIPYADQYVFDWRTATGTPSMFIEYPVGTIALISVPVAQVAVVSTIAIEPTATTTVLPDDLVREHKDSIVSGAISYLSIIPNVPWFSVEFGSMHKSIFNEGKRRAIRTFNLHMAHPMLITTSSPI